MTETPFFQPVGSIGHCDHEFGIGQGNCIGYVSVVIWAGAVDPGGATQRWLAEEARNMLEARARSDPDFRARIEATMRRKPKGKAPK